MCEWRQPFEDLVTDFYSCLLFCCRLFFFSCSLWFFFVYFYVLFFLLNIARAGGLDLVGAGLGRLSGSNHITSLYLIVFTVLCVFKHFFLMCYPPLLICLLFCHVFVWTGWRLVPLTRHSKKRKTTLKSHWLLPDLSARAALLLGIHEKYLKPSITTLFCVSPHRDMALL